MPRELTSRQVVELERHWPETQVAAPRPYYSHAEFTAAPGDPVALGAITAPLWRRKGTILALAAVGLILGGAISYFMTPIYRAHTSVQLEGFSNDQISPITVALPNAAPG